MPTINRDYWNKYIPETKTSKTLDDSWVKTHIEGHDYYGKSLKGKHFEKCKIVVGKIIPLFLLSIALAPISIPVLFATGTFRKLGIWIREVHYNTKIKFIANISTQISQNASQQSSEDEYDINKIPQELQNIISSHFENPTDVASFRQTKKSANTDAARAILTTKRKEFIEKYAIFDEEEWKKIGIDVENTPLPRGIKQILESPCPITKNQTIGESHVLVLIPGKINGQTLDLKMFYGILNNNGFPQVNYGPGKCPFKSKDQPYYILMPKKLICGTKTHLLTEAKPEFKNMAKLSKDASLPYEIPSLLEAVVCIYAQYFRDQTLIFEKEYLHTKDKIKGLNAIVGHMQINGGLYITTTDNFDSWGYQEDNGLAPLIRF